jgi:uncharacterized protein
MNLSEERQIYLAHLLFNFLYDEDLVDFSDEDLAIRVAKQGVSHFVKEDFLLSEKAKNKIKTLKRQIPENSPEWDILFQKYYEEEKAKQGKK